MSKLLAALTVGLMVILSLAPTVSAHAAPEPLDNSVHVLEDEPEDAFYWYDGYDLYNLFIREAYMQTLDESGLVFRFALYGGFAPAGVAEEMAIDIGATSAEGAQLLTLATNDDAEWDGDMEVLVANVSEDELPYTGVTAKMQVFASYEDLGVAPGGSLENIWMESRADEDVRDRAPGGVFVPHSQGEGEVPTESQRLVDSLELAGPHGYVDTSITPAGDGLNVTVENTLSNGQHVQLRLDAPEGWNASLPETAQVSLGGEETTSFLVEAEADERARQPLRVNVVTDLGGFDTTYVGVDGTDLVTDIDPNAVDVEPEQETTNESPGAASLAAIVALAGSSVLAGTRRDRRG